MQTENRAPAPDADPLAGLDLSILSPVTRDLAPLMSPDLVAELVASALRLAELGSPTCGGCRYRDPALTAGHPEIVRDTECPTHGVDADRAWWRTPAHLRSTDHDTPPPPPAMTAHEAAADAARDGWDARDRARGGRR